MEMKAALASGRKKVRARSRVPPTSSLGQSPY
jgi:hypothetical protein